MNTNTTLTIVAIIVVALLGACGGSDCPACDDRYQPCPDAGDAPDAEPDVDIGPPTGVPACKAWETGSRPIEAMASCVDALGSQRVACVEAVRQYWHASCAADCVGTGNDHLQNLDCYCKCMVEYASPYDGDAGENCELDYSDLYECWMSES